MYLRAVRFPIFIPTNVKNIWSSREYTVVVLNKLIPRAGACLRDGKARAAAARAHRDYCASRPPAARAAFIQPSDIDNSQQQ